MAVQLVLCRVLPLGLVHNCSQHSCVVAVKLFLRSFSLHSCSSIDMTAAWKKLCFILLVRSDFYMTDSLSIAVHAFVSHVSITPYGLFIAEI